MRLPDTLMERPQYTCEFWINNCEFEVFFDLSKQNSPDFNTSEIADDECVTYEEVHINDLPTEMLSRIFGFCQAIDLLAVQMVCERWKEIVQADKALWNHLVFSAADLDVKTTASLLREMPLLRSISMCNVHSAEEMTYITSVLCDVCWQLRQVHFPETCDWHPSALNVFQLAYYHPRITDFKLCTKQKLTSLEISGLGAELSGFAFLQKLTLVGFYWHQPDLLPNLLSQIAHLASLTLPSVPGLSGSDLAGLKEAQPDLEELTLNISSLQGRHLVYLRHLPKLKDLKIIDRSALTVDKLQILHLLPCLTSMDIDLSNCNKDDVLKFFSAPRNNLIEIFISNCRFSDSLLAYLPKACWSLRTIHWLNPKDTTGEMTDAGLIYICQLKLLEKLIVRSLSITNINYSALASMRSLKCVRINGMKIHGCL